MAKTVKFKKVIATQVVKSNPGSTDENRFDRANAARQQGVGPEVYEVENISVGGGNVTELDDTIDYAEELNTPNRPGKVIGSVDSMRYIEQIREDVIYNSSPVGSGQDIIKYPKNNTFNISTGISEIDDTSTAVEAADYVEHSVTFKEGDVVSVVLVDKTPHNNTARFSKRSLAITNQAGYGATAFGERFGKMINDNDDKLSHGADYSRIATLPDLPGIANYFWKMSNYTTTEILFALIFARRYMSMSTRDRSIYGYEVNDAYIKYKEGVHNILAFKNDSVKIKTTAEITFLNYLPNIIKAAEQQIASVRWFIDPRHSVFTKKEISDILFGNYSAAEEADYVKRLTYGVKSVRLVRPYPYSNVSYNPVLGNSLDATLIPDGFGGNCNHYYQAGKGSTAQPKVKLTDPILDGISKHLRYNQNSRSDFGTAGKYVTVNTQFSEEDPTWAFLILESISDIIDYYTVVMEDFIKTLDLLGCSNGCDGMVQLSKDIFSKLVKSADAENFNSSSTKVEVNVNTRFNYPIVARKYGSYNPAGWAVGEKSKHEYLPWCVGSSTFVDDGGIIDFTGRLEVPSELSEGDKSLDLIKIIDPILLIDDNNFEAKDGEGESTETHKYPLYNFDDGFYFNFDYCNPISYLKGRQLYGFITPIPTWFNNVSYDSMKFGTSMSNKTRDTDPTLPIVKKMNEYLFTPFKEEAKVVTSRYAIVSDRVKLAKRREIKCKFQLSTWTIEFPIKYDKDRYLHVIIPNGLLNNDGCEDAVKFAAETAKISDLSKVDCLAEAKIYDPSGNKFNYDLSDVIAFALNADAVSTGDGYYESCDTWAYWMKRMMTFANPMVGMSKAGNAVGSASVPHQIMSNDDYIKVRISWRKAIDNAINVMKIKTPISNTKGVVEAPVDNPTVFALARSGYKPGNKE